MAFLDLVLRRAAFCAAAAVVLLAPWLFGAWEMWWFWPLAGGLFLSTLLFALRLLLSARAADGVIDLEARRARRLRAAAVLSFVPFLVYAAVRTAQSDVYYDAERSFLLFLTPFLLAVQILFGFTARERDALWALILGDLCLLGAYAFANHALTGSRRVLWLEGYAQYYTQDRVSGSYFCPDHFSGIMELAVGLGAAALIARESSRGQRVLGGLAAGIGLAGVVLSKSRGGGLAVLVMAAALMAFGFAQWPRPVRWSLRGVAAVAGALALAAFLFVGRGYCARFLAYFGWEQARGLPAAEQRALILYRLEASDRWQMITAALRAWRTAPLAGIGPGMHVNVWPHIAASPDGDRAARRWPTHLNNQYHSNAVHNDWVQLLEEYGLIGFGLFLLSAGAGVAVLLGGLARATAELRRADWRLGGGERFAALLGGLLGAAALAFHSLGDFNLQMPATAWLFGAILGLAAAAATPYAEPGGAPP